ncbi:MAG: hypothetical protein AAFR63_07750 [Cyanobacteria bacterium J06631_6]
MEIKFVDELESKELAIAVERLESSISNQHPEIQNIFIEAKSISAKRKAKEKEQDAVDTAVEVAE